MKLHQLNKVRVELTNLKNEADETERDGESVPKIG